MKQKLPIRAGYYLVYDECGYRFPESSNHENHQCRSPHVEFSTSLKKLKKLIDQRAKLYKSWKNGRFVDDIKFFKVSVTEVD